MNFKIENNFLDITNYPSIERHFEDMASKGWLISRIILGSIFIYKKIEPEELDFSITPYEIETAFTRKSKEELEEFNSVCKSVGWNYAAKSFDLHIHFKEKGSEAIDIQTDEEEEFKTLEFIGKKYIRSYYIQMPFMLFFAWMLLGGLFSNIYTMKDGLAQIVAPLIPVVIILIVVQLINIKGFLKTNKKNIELGKSIEFSDSKFQFYKFAFVLAFITLFIVIIYALYASLFFKNKLIIIGLLPIIISSIIAGIYRIFIKPSKKTLRYKVVVFAVGMVVVVLISSWIGMFNIGKIIDRKDNPNIDVYKVLSANDFEDIFEEEGDLMERVSFLIPKSYEYYSYVRGHDSVRTEYSKVLTEKLASNLVNRYKRQGKNALKGRYSFEMLIYFDEDTYDDYFLTAGLTEADLNNIKEKDRDKFMKIAQEIINERSIVEDKENLYNVDEAYFLNYEKTEIVLRDGKEVFYLEGKDFSDVEIIKIVKNKLGLN